MLSATGGGADDGVSRVSTGPEHGSTANFPTAQTPPGVRTAIRQLAPFPFGPHDAAER